MNFSAEGLVVKETSFGDNDKILTILTKEYGCIQAWARGSKRIKSPLLPISHVFTYACFDFFKNKENCSVRSGTLTESYFELRNDIERLSLAGYVAELAAKVAPENMDTAQLLSLTLNTLYLLAKTKKSSKIVKSVYEMRLMCIEGYLPQLDGCIECGGESAFFFDEKNGGLKCAKCATAADIPINPSVLKALIHICYSEDKLVFSFTLNDENLNTLSSLCEKYALYQLDLRPKTLEFYKSLL